jgi:TetR/AcrR family transcriptional regulator, lmrAB and yxaGH operons repressor
MPSASTQASVTLATIDTFCSLVSEPSGIDIWTSGIISSYMMTVIVTNMMIIIVKEFLMPGRVNVKQSMVNATLRLVRRRGISASGMQDIVKEADAPRGSIYFHFPGGKAQMLAEAVELATAQGEQAILRCAEQSASISGFIDALGRVFGYEAHRAGWATGCPLAATAAEGDVQPVAVRHVVAAGFNRWEAAIAVGLTRFTQPDEARRAATLVLAAFEGALLTSRAARDAAPFENITAILGEMLGQYLPTGVSLKNDSPHPAR